MKPPSILSSCRRFSATAANPPPISTKQYARISTSTASNQSINFTNSIDKISINVAGKAQAPIQTQRRAWSSSNYATLSGANDLGRMFAPKPTMRDDSGPKKLLSSEQEALLSLMISGASVYFTGKAGSGKTEVLTRFIKHCRANPATRFRTEVTAPTGIAAAHIKGSTLASRFALIPTQDPQLNNAAELIKRAMAKPAILANFITTQVLIIDEISMVNKRDFEAISKAMGTLKSDKTSCDRVRTFLEEKARKIQKFRNTKLTIKETLPGKILNDGAKYLNEIEASSSKNFYDSEAKDQPFGGAQVVLCGDFFQLPPIERDCAALQIYRNNIAQLYTESEMEYALSPYVFTGVVWQKLRQQGMKCVMLDKSFRQLDPQFVNFLDRVRVGEWDNDMIRYLEPQLDNFDSDKLRPIKLSSFKKDAEDYNRKNLEKLTGTKMNFSCADTVMSITENETQWELINKFSMEFNQMPVEKSLTLRIGAQVILTKNLNVSKGLVNGSRGEVVGYVCSRDILSNKAEMLPVVQFKGVCQVIQYAEFENHLSPDVKIMRRQIPLKLGWGLTIHRSQGMTLDSVIIDMPLSFAAGQAYVGLSRVKSLDGLAITRNIEKGGIIVDNLVKKFYAEMQDKDAWNEHML